MATIVNTSLNTEPRLGNLRYNLSTMERSVNPVMSVDVEKFGKGEDLSDTKPTQKIHESFEDDIDTTKKDCSKLYWQPPGTVLQ